MDSRGERAKIQADADVCRESELLKTKPGSAEYKKRLAQLKGRPDEGGAGGLDGKLKEASAKFDDALREALKVADAQTSTWGREVMMEVLHERNSARNSARNTARNTAKIGHFAPGHSTGRAKSGHFGTQTRTLWYLAQDTTAPDTL